MQRLRAINSSSALILDRDGTLNAMICNSKGEQDSPYFASQLELYPNLGELLQPFAQAQIPIFITTNQPGMAKGHFTEKDLRELNQALVDQLSNFGITIKEVLFCPHHPIGTPEGDQSLIRECDCRKPKPGMLFQIQKKYGINLSKAIYIGDSKADQDACQAAGIGNFHLVRTFISETVPIKKRINIFPHAPLLKHVLLKLQAP